LQGSLATNQMASSKNQKASFKNQTVTFREVKWFIAKSLGFVRIHTGFGKESRNFAYNFSTALFMSCKVSLRSFGAPVLVEMWHSSEMAHSIAY